MLKILIHSVNAFCTDSFLRTAKNNSVEYIITSDEKTLFEYCTLQSLSGYIISSEFEYAQRAIDTIKGTNPGVPIISISHPNSKDIVRKNVDLTYLIHGAEATDAATNSILLFIEHQLSLYSRLKSLTPTPLNEIYFGEGFKYDVIYRNLHLNSIELKRFSAKEGKLLEVLARNYRNVVKRDALLEEVWHKTDIYSSRSSDVYVTKLRNFFREYDLNLTIKNISGVGLLLDKI
jgi:hypothetical protein